MKWTPILWQVQDLWIFLRIIVICQLFRQYNIHRAYVSIKMKILVLCGNRYIDSPFIVIYIVVINYISCCIISKLYNEVKLMLVVWRYNWCVYARGLDTQALVITSIFRETTENKTNSAASPELPCLLLKHVPSLSSIIHHKLTQFSW